MSAEDRSAAGTRPLVAGNWKMHGLVGSLAEFESMVEETRDGRIAADLLICPPATLVQSFVAAARGSCVKVGGQDCHAKVSGAFTGDISAEMFADVGASAIIVGHSERRTGYGESDADVSAKASAVLRAGLTAIICIGETEAEREAGETLAVLRRQLAGSVPDDARAASVTIAYEPVWAIGSGRTPSVEEVAATHAAIRAALVSRFGPEGEGMRILYGGSVKPSNAAELLCLPNVDGALVGGASLKAADFIAIAEAASN